MNIEESQSLIHVLKLILDKGIVILPKQGESLKIELRSVFSNRDRFFVIMNRKAKINPGKYTLLLQYGKEHGLIRIDVGGAPHINPDGSVVPCPHIHLQQNDKGKWDRWATDLPALFGDCEDKLNTFIDFLKYCNANNIAQVKICSQEEMR